MKILTYEGVVENGCIHLLDGVILPEKAKVYVVVPNLPDANEMRIVHIRSPRLVNSEQANAFVMEMVDIDEFEKSVEIPKNIENSNQ